MPSSKNTCNFPFFFCSSDSKMTQHNQQCGMFNCYPKFMQRFATTRAFIAIYGLLGIFQAMGYIYFTVTLQTIEKRFKIPSQTTGTNNSRKIQNVIKIFIKSIDRINSQWQ